MRLPIRVEGTDKEIVDTEALLDSGAEGLFIDREFAERNRLPLERLKEPILVRNVDGTPNKNGTIECSTTLNLEIN